MTDFDVTETNVPVLREAYLHGPELMMQLLGERVTARLLAMDPDPCWRPLWDLHQELLLIICDALADGTLQPNTPVLDAWRDFVAKRPPHDRI